MEWTAFVGGKTIEYKFNGRQKLTPFDKNTKYAVDGYDPENNVVYQFHGCCFHGHGCMYGKVADSATKRENTHIVTTRLRNLGFTVIEKWECEWWEERKLPAVKRFLDNT